ncbi:hypothetical protein ABIB60_002790 [Hymenobacter sp. UYP22]
MLEYGSIAMYNIAEEVLTNCAFLPQKVIRHAE